MITKEKVLEALKEVMDPDLKKDLVTLNMIDKVEINNNFVSFDLVLTTPACPFKKEIKQNCIDSIKRNIPEAVEVNVNFASQVNNAKRKNTEILKGVKNIIAVTSAKGGVGKSTVASNLAVALAKTGAKVGLLDADIYGPSIPLMFDVVNERPLVDDNIKDKQMIIPIEKYGVKMISIGFFVEKEKAIVWRGPMASGALKQLFTDVSWGLLDYIVIDMPPGTGDIQLTLAQEMPVTGVVIVTTPQKVATADAEKGINMYKNKDLNIPILGMVENMSYFTPAELPNNKYYIFGKDGGKKLAEKYKIPLLGEIPLVQSIAEGGDNGAPVVLESSTPAAKAFMEFAKKTAQAISIRNIMMGEQ